MDASASRFAARMVMFFCGADLCQDAPRLVRRQVAFVFAVRQTALRGQD
jgi:hypothetical protein